MLDFAVSFLEGKRGMNCDVHVAVNVVGILNSLMILVRQPLLNYSIKKFKSINLNPSATLFSKQFCYSSRH